MEGETSEMCLSGFAALSLVAKHRSRDIKSNPLEKRAKLAVWNEFASNPHAESINKYPT